METYKKDTSAVEQRIREAYENQLIDQPEICTCDCFSRYKNAREVWEQRIEELELEIKRLHRRLRVRTLNRKLKVRTGTHSLQHNL